MRTSESSREVLEDSCVREREAMVEKQIRQRGLTDERVLRAIAAVPRHEFVPPSSLSMAYADEPLGIGGGQTISQPYIVAAMTAALRLSGKERVLDVGTGCGYQAAVLSLLAREVFSVEVRSELAESAKQRLRRLGYGNVDVRCGDGSMGLSEFAPFDAILIAAAGPSVPEPLLVQLGDGGRLIGPVGGDDHQQLILVIRQGNEFLRERRESCRFVPLIGRHGWNRREPL